MKALPVLTSQTLPAPFPAGWYVLGFSEELKRGEVLTRRLAGVDVVLFRSQSGTAAAVAPFCPHLGAHLGAGRVEGENLRCPMHGFCFSPDGQCVSTPYAKKIPPKARARVRALREQGGMLLVFHDPLGFGPTWDVPVHRAEDWTPLMWRRLEFRGHPQETSENSVDLGHFAAVHGYESVTLGNEFAEGAYFHSEMAAVRPRGLVSRQGRLRIETSIHVHGLGYSYVDVNVPTLQLTTRHFVLSTPTEADRVELRIASCIRRDFLPARMHWALGLVPRRVFMGIMQRAVIRSYLADVRQDVPLWSSKTYLHRPALAAGDGPIARYRQWARQFYPDPAHLVSPATEPAEPRHAA